MKFEEFYQKYFKNEKGDFYRFAKEGMGRMKRSIDPLHDKFHIENIFEMLDAFLIKHKKIKAKTDMKALFLSICWHDAWKAKRFPKTIFQIAYGQVTEGVFAARLFKKEAKKYAIDRQIINKAAYAIRKHSTLQFLKHKTLEAKILKDIDKIDSVNFERFLYAKNKNFKFQNRRHLFLISLYISKVSRDTYNFSWTKDILIAKRKEFLERLKEARNSK